MGSSISLWVAINQNLPKYVLASTAENIPLVQALIMKYIKQTVEGVCNYIGFSNGSIQIILTEHLKFSKIC